MVFFVIIDLIIASHLFLFLAHLYWILFIFLYFGIQFPITKFFFFILFVNIVFCLPLIWVLDPENSQKITLWPGDIGNI